MITTQQYQLQLNDEAYPAIANAFLCWSLLQETIESYRTAGWAAMNAAWASDDCEERNAGLQCRLRAIRLFKAAHRRGIAFAEEIGAEEAILADLLRRTNRYEEVKVVCRAGIAKQPGEIIQKVLKYQMKLSNEHDTARYTIEDALASTTD